MIRSSVSCVAFVLLAAAAQAAGLPGSYLGTGTCGDLSLPVSSLVVSETGPGRFAADFGGVAYTLRVDENGSGILKRRGPIDPGYGNGHGAVLDVEVEPGGDALRVSGEFPGIGSCRGTWIRAAE